MNLLKWLSSLVQVPEPDVPPALPEREVHPCGVSDCYEPQVLLHQDDRLTVVECPLHRCVTSWDTAPLEQKTQKIIRVQDSWHQHGSRGR